MDKNEKIVVVTGVILILVPNAIGAIKTVRKGRNDRKEIEAQKLRGLIDIAVAEARVGERIKAGQYKNLDDAVNDLNFEIITNQLDI